MASVAFKRTVKVGMKGNDCYAIKRALKRKGFGSGLTLKGPARFNFGAKSGEALKKFQKRYKLTADGVYGAATHRTMVNCGGFDAYGRYLMASAPVTQAASGVRDRIVAAAVFGSNHRGAIHYTQSSLRMYGVRNKIRIPKIPIYEDCSSFATWCYWHAGGPDPNGRGYDGYGFTGTMAAHGKRVSSPLPGDLLLYGPGPNFSHVTVFIGNGKCVSHGSEAGPMVLAWNYRPVSQIRRYV